AKPTEKHLNEVKRIFRYLRGTVNTGLWYSKDSGFELTGFSDADYAGCKDTFKSTFGGAQFLGEKLVSWSSKKQDCTALSTAEAEYVSLSACCAQVLWMRTQLTDYGFHFNKILIYCDSKSAIVISCNSVQHSKTKHIAVRYHFIKEHVEKGTIELYFVKTDYQLADIFTKALPSDRFNYLVRRLARAGGIYPGTLPLDRVEVIGFDNLVKESWSKPVLDEQNSMDRLKKKFQNLKASIKMWRKEGNIRKNDIKASIQKELSNLDKIIDQEMAQKAKVRWAIEGDENSKFFHGVINKKRSQLAIKGVLVDGEWISETIKVRNEFLMHFSNRFFAPPSSKLSLDSQFDKVLSQEQNEDLERPISKDEIKSAVWDCGTNKSPGPNGFTLEFIRKYWNIICVDIKDDVSHFFNTCTFSQGCNSSFIALIPKMQDAKLVKDFRPITLIGCIYKIVTKLLANRLCTFIPDLSDVQSAFVTNRHILNGPFILSELLSWCKQNKFQYLIFKVDFEKAFDLVRWDYLDEVLLNFRFGSKWRGWINGCLSSSMGSVLVNGSPTTEFKFYKGLKQRDPLSLILFILVMESLHLAFTNVLNAGIFKGEVSNISAIVNVLNIFHMASGLKINIHKSKLMGVGMSKEEVDSAARYPRGGIEKSQFDMLCSNLADVTLPHSRDRWVWNLDPIGDFSVKSVRDFIDDLMLPNEGTATRWIKYIPLKINIFSWRVYLDKLPTRANISLRGIDIPNIMCHICNSSVESSDHLFFSCKLAKDLFKKVTRWWELEYVDIHSYGDWLEWIKSLKFPNRLKDIFEAICYVLWWSIWKHRNQSIFGGMKQRLGNFL
nr:RNA-directed DNA polymerase, eukaryota, reverse transcriptase zinc-binding domain protein [Tanacetum cinerariifolium]